MTILIFAKNHNIMKKILLSMAFALVAILAHAQEVQMDFIPFHYSGSLFL